MQMRQIALVSETQNTVVAPSVLMKVAAALQKQVTRDLSPRWEIQATVDAFDDLDEVPIGYWPMIVVDDVPNAEGVHLDKNGQPYALVEYGDEWSLTASHECLEMLVDPSGNKTAAGPSPIAGQGIVEFLVEVCDPSEDASFGYEIDGILVSDFYLPTFFSPIVDSATRYSFTAAIKKPRQVLTGGYLSWRVPATDHWWQERWFGGSQSTHVDLGVFSTANQIRSVRSWLYSQTQERRDNMKASTAVARAAMLASAAGGSNPSSRARYYRSEIELWKKRT